MSIPRFSVRNSVLVNVAMILIIAMGAFALVSMPSELFPQVRLNRVIVGVYYPGASPEEVEKLILTPIEEEIKDVDHVDFYYGSAEEGRAELAVVFKQISEAEFRRVFQDLRQEVDKVDFPEEVEDPIFVSLESSTWLPMATLAVSGDLPERRLKEIAEELQDEIESTRGIDDTSLAGVREREIWVEVDPVRLNKHALTLQQVSQALARQNVSLPSGNIKVGQYEYLLRSVEEFKSLRDIEETVILSDAVGNHVRIRDIGQVREAFEEARTLSRVDGKPAVSINVYKSSGGSTLELVELFREMARTKMEGLPSGVRVTVVGDNSPRIRDSINRLTNNGIFGGILVLVVLMVILGWRNAVIVFWGIPITFLMTFVFLELYGESINESTLFALVLVLGMIVDDAIVVVENVARYLNRGMRPFQAAVKGTEEVMWPVVSSSLTTIAAFLPLMLLPGVVGEFMKVIPVTVCLALVASLFESMVILPSHVADFGKSDPERHQSRPNRLIRRVATFYRRMLGPILRWRWVFLPIVLTLILSSFLVIGLVGVDLYQDDQRSVIFMRLWMPEGSRIDTTDELARRLENIALALPEEERISVLTQIGVLNTDSNRFTGKNMAQIVINVVEQNDRSRTLEEIMAELRSRSEDLVGYRRLEVATPTTGPPVGKPVEVKVRGRRFDQLKEISERVQAYLKTQAGVHTVQDDFEEGKKEVRVRIDESRAQLMGIDTSDVARQLKGSFDGLIATVYRDGDEEIDVIVKLQPEYRAKLQDIENLRIPTASGELVPFDSVARYEVVNGFADIRHFGGDRAITVSAEVVPGVTSGVEVTRKLREAFAGIGQEFPGYRLDFRGEFQEFQQTFDNVTRLFIIGLILMYLILAAQFRSYVQPILVMFAIPFAFAGAMLCLLVNNYMFSINVMFGMVALSGVAVNDSIVLISFINSSRNQGASLYRAILNGAKRRMRPIFLTTVTTIFGLLPMALGMGGRSVTWIPLAATIVWGLGMATLLIVLVIPPLYVALEDVRRLFVRGESVKIRESEAELAPTPLRRVG